MEILVALQATLKVMAKEISLLSFGMYQDMTDTKIVGLFFIRKLMVSAKSHWYDTYPVITYVNNFYFKSEWE